MVLSDNIADSQSDILRTLPQYMDIIDDIKKPIMDKYLAIKIDQLNNISKEYSSKNNKIELDSIEKFAQEFKIYKLMYENDTEFKNWIDASRNRKGKGRGALPGYKKEFGRYKYWRSILEFRKNNDIKKLYHMEKEYNVNMQKYNDILETNNRSILYNERLKVATETINNFTSSEQYYLFAGKKYGKQILVQNAENIANSETNSSVGLEHKCKYVKYKTCTTVYHKDFCGKIKKYYKCSSCGKRRKKVN